MHYLIPIHITYQLAHHDGGIEMRDCYFARDSETTLEDALNPVVDNVLAKERPSCAADVLAVKEEA